MASSSSSTSAAAGAEASTTDDDSSSMMVICSSVLHEFFDSSSAKKSPQTVVATSKILLTLLQNAVSSSSSSDADANNNSNNNKQHRTIRLENPKIQQHVVNVPGALDVLSLAGFERVEQPRPESTTIGGPRESVLIFQEQQEQAQAVVDKGRQTNNTTTSSVWEMYLQDDDDNDSNGGGGGGNNNNDDVTAAASTQQPPPKKKQQHAQQKELIQALCTGLQAKINELQPLLLSAEKEKQQQKATAPSTFLSEEERQGRQQKARAVRKAKQAQRAKEQERWEEDKQARKQEAEQREAIKKKRALQETTNNDHDDDDVTLLAQGITIARKKKAMTLPLAKPMEPAGLDPQEQRQKLAAEARANAQKQNNTSSQHQPQKMSQQQQQPPSSSTIVWPPNWLPYQPPPPTTTTGWHAPPFLQQEQLQSFIDAHPYHPSSSSMPPLSSFFAAAAPKNTDQKSLGTITINGKTKEIPNPYYKGNNKKGPPIVGLKDQAAAAAAAKSGPSNGGEQKDGDDNNAACSMDVVMDDQHQQDLAATSDLKLPSSPFSLSKKRPLPPSSSAMSDKKDGEDGSKSAAGMNDDGTASHAAAAAPGSSQKKSTKKNRAGVHTIPPAPPSYLTKKNRPGFHNIPPAPPSYLHSLASGLGGGPSASGVAAAAGGPILAFLDNMEMVRHKVAAMTSMGSVPTSNAPSNGNAAAAAAGNHQHQTNLNLYPLGVHWGKPTSGSGGVGKGGNQQQKPLPKFTFSSVSDMAPTAAAGITQPSTSTTTPAPLPAAPPATFTNDASWSWEQCMEHVPRCEAAEGIRDTSVFFKDGGVPMSGPTTSLKRLFKELDGLKDSLPTDSNASIFIRFDEETPQYMRAIMAAPLPGPTPYSGGMFAFDIFIPGDYPNVPPKVILLNTGGGSVRFGPNLYANGKVCLSLLGTWSGPKWNSKHSSLYQVLISIQGLILGVEHPYFLEPSYGGWEGRVKEGTFQTSSKGQTLDGQVVEQKVEMGVPQQAVQYEDKLRIATVKFSMDFMVKASMAASMLEPGRRGLNMSYGFLKAFALPLQAHFYHNRNEILKEVHSWQSDSICGRKRTHVKSYSPKLAIDQLKTLLPKLEALLSKMEMPKIRSDSTTQAPLASSSLPCSSTTATSTTNVEETKKPAAVENSKNVSVTDIIESKGETTTGKTNDLDVLEPKRASMKLAAERGDFVRAGELQGEIQRAEDIYRKMQDAAKQNDFIRAGRLQAQFKSLTGQDDPPVASLAATGRKYSGKPGVYTAGTSATAAGGYYDDDYYEDDYYDDDYYDDGYGPPGYGPPPGMSGPPVFGGMLGPTMGGAPSSFFSGVMSGIPGVTFGGNLASGGPHGMTPSAGNGNGSLYGGPPPPPKAPPKSTTNLGKNASAPPPYKSHGGTHSWGAGNQLGHDSQSASAASAGTGHGSQGGPLSAGIAEQHPNTSNSLGKFMYAAAPAYKFYGGSGKNSWGNGNQLGYDSQPVSAMATESVAASKPAAAPSKSALPPKKVIPPDQLCRLRIRLPNDKSAVEDFDKTETLSAVYRRLTPLLTDESCNHSSIPAPKVARTGAFAQPLSILGFTLLLTRPKREFSLELHGTKTLLDLNLAPSATLTVMRCSDRGVMHRGELESRLREAQGDACDVEGLTYEGLVELTERVGSAGPEEGNAFVGLSANDLEENSSTFSPATYLYELDTSTKEGHDEESRKCPICLGNYDATDETNSLRRLHNCEHCFHSSCLETWLKTKASCPLCKTSIVAEDQA